MDKRLSGGAVGFANPSETLGRLEPAVAARVLAAAGDIALVLDGEGVIRDLAVTSPDIAYEGLQHWLGRPWVDTVADDSRPKVKEMLGGGEERWREVNQLTPSGETAPIRFITIDAAGGRRIALGRDLKAVATMQQRLLQAQQAMERDYARLRQAESRYRMLFRLASEAVLIVEAASGKVLEANPAAEHLLARGDSGVVGEGFTTLFEPGDRPAASGLIASLQSGGRTDTLPVRLAGAGLSCFISASLFRHDRAAHVMVRLWSEERAPPTAGAAQQRLLDALERMPDAFVVTDEDLRIIAQNAAFIELTQLAAPAQAEMQSLERFIGRPGVDLKVLVAGLKEHGAVRNFATITRSQFDTTEEVEISAVSLLDAQTPSFAFSIRQIGRRLRDQPAPGRELPRSVGQLTSLVGRVSLKEIVRETTDRIERLCIEAALELTADNRASAAELLGLSRQSFYSKLHRHGLGNLGADDE